MMFFVVVVVKIRFLTNEVHIKDGGMACTPYERELRCGYFGCQKNHAFCLTEASGLCIIRFF